VTKLNWSLVAAARDGGGRITPAKLKAVLAGADLESETAAFAGRGYKFSLTPRGSLQLVEWPNRLFAEEIAHELRTDVVGKRVETHWSTTSTNDLAKNEAARRREGTAVFAEEQTAGRGRFGRRWTAPKFSALLFSMALHGALKEPAAEALALAGAAAVAEAIDETYRLPARIRWPNDVLIEERKVSGVLVENIGADADGRWFVIGIGVNVNVAREAFSPELRDTAASISEFICGRADRALIARAILRRLDFWWEMLKAGQLQRLSETCRRLSALMGRFVTVESGGKRYTGRVVDLDQQYGLVLQLSGGPTRVFAPGQTTLIHQ